jgi:uncharacterized RDD family membrane protein YckC
VSDDKVLITESGHSLCAFPRRLMIMVYDALVLLGLLIIASALALPLGGAGKVAFRDPGFTLWLLFACFAYFAICWRRGVTVGMRAWKTRLVSTDQQTLSWATCLLRFLVGILSVLAGGLGIWWALWDKDKRTWHDIAA